jgi:putative DNA primase/helicase
VTETAEEWAKQTAAKFRERRMANGHHAAADNTRNGAHVGNGKPKEQAGRETVNLTDVGNGKRLVNAHGADLRHCHLWAKWFVWDGKHWEIDQSAAVTLRAKRVMAELAQWAARQIEAATKEMPTATDERLEELKKQIAKANGVLAWCLKSEAAPRINAMLDMARSEPGIPILPDKLDGDPWLLNVANGTIDLKTGKLREHRREDYATKLCPVAYDPNARCDTWANTLELIFDRNENLVEYVRRVLGHALTGDTNEQALWLWWGAGSNGKSLIINTILELLGEDYAIKAPRDLFLAKKSDQHPTNIARLFGRRLVVCTETGNAARLDESLAKELTGGDVITARRMREDYWQFRPVFKPIMVTNHKPQIRGTDDGIWRRCRLVPFTQRFWDPERGESGPAELQADKALPEKLRAEFPGILAWLVRGCIAWQREGLATPSEVLAATNEYRAEQDVLGAFLAECCEVHPDCRAKVGELYAAYQEWAKGNGEYERSATAFGLSMRERGFKKDGGKRWYIGVSITDGVRR